MSLDLSSNYLQFKIAMAESSKNVMYSFDRFVLDAEKLMLYRDGDEILLPPKVVKTLTILIEHRGSIISKNDLIEQVWSDSVVEESNLSQYLYLLRKTLGSKADGSSYIETLRRRGYRFAADVEVTNSAKATAHKVIEPTSRPQNIISVQREGNVLRLVDWKEAAEGEPAKPEVLIDPPTGHVENILRRVSLAGAVVIVLAIGVTTFFVYRYSAMASNERKETSVIRLTNGRFPVGATISPDGNFIAYHESYGDVIKMFVQQVGQASRIEIASSSDLLFNAATFSPDGRFVFSQVVNRSKNSETSLIRVPVIGGPITKILEGIEGPVSFSPDGNEMVFLRSNIASDESSLVMVESNGNNERIILKRRGSTLIGAGPAWSPNGKTIAFSEQIAGEKVADRIKHINLLDISDGSITKVSGEEWENVYRMSWTNNGDGLVLIGTRANEGYTVNRDQIYFVSVADGRSSRVTTDGNRHEPGSLGVAKSGAILAVTGNRSAQIWSMSSNGDQSTAVQLTLGSSDGRAGLCPLPDGRITYMTRGINELNVWIINADGSGSTQISTGFPYMEELRADSKGRYLVFSGLKDKTNQLFKIGIDGSGLKQITDRDEPSIDSTISPDGKLIVFGSSEIENGIQRPILRTASVENGEQVKLGNVECQTPTFSPDGSLVSCINLANEAIVMSAQDGREIERVKLPANATTNFGTGWTPDSLGLTVILNEKGTSNIWIFPRSGDKPRPLTNFTSGVIYRYANSSDGSRIIVARGYPVHDAVLISNYY